MNEDNHTVLTSIGTLEFAKYFLAGVSKYNFMLVIVISNKAKLNSKKLICG